MAEIVILPVRNASTASAQPSDHLVSLLEQLLQEAKAGDVTAIAISYCRADETVDSGIVGRCEDIYTLRMIGSLSLLKDNIMRMFDAPIAEE